MTDAELKARGERARVYRDEFLGPIMDEQRAAYQARIVEIATTELNPRKRAEKITALSTALKVLNNVDAGLSAAVDAGRIAEGNLLKAERIEKMGKEQRRLLSIAPF